MCATTSTLYTIQAMASSTKATTTGAFAKFKKRMNVGSASVPSNAHSNSSNSQTSGHRATVQHIDYDDKVRFGLQVPQQSVFNSSTLQSAQPFYTSLTASQAGDDSVHEQYPLAR
jgi:hypothetical protein